MSKKIICFLTVLALLLTLVPGTLAAEAPMTVTLTGNTGAVIRGADEASTKDTELVRVIVREGFYEVAALPGAVGIARVEARQGETVTCWQIPVGYTTFVFSGDRLTVIPGDGANYEISGINAADQEYLVGSKDPALDLPVTYDEDGNQVFTNTDAYKINVGIKKKGGTYVLCGASQDMTVTVKKEATGPSTLLLAGLELASSFTSPVTIKKGSTTTATLMALEGWVNTLSDTALNNADVYGDPTTDGGNGANPVYAESAVIKAKSGAQLTLTGAGTLNLNCLSKNAIKGAESSRITLEELTLNVSSVKHGISADNVLSIRSGKYTITASDDAIRSDPDAVDADLGAAGLVEIAGGTFTIQAGSDGISAAQNVTITGGDFAITTGKGYNDSTFNSKTMSCKGIKASGGDEDADTSEATNTVAISGGTFDLNCADDAIHSDAFVNITGGKFYIRTGDDGVHADTTLNVGAQGAGLDSLTLEVNQSYEGLEAGTVNIYAGRISVAARDDGINAAGGSDGSGGGGFNPRPGWPGNPSPSPTGNYSLNVYGGQLRVDVSGDGLDSNGSLSLLGGDIIVFGQAAGGDNEPLDSDGTLTIQGATVFAAGSSRMTTTPRNSQPYITSKTSISSGRTVNIKYNGTTIFNIKATKALNYVLYSSPAMTSTTGWTISADTSALLPVDPGPVTPDPDPEPPVHSHSFSLVGTIPAAADAEGYEIYGCDCGAQYHVPVPYTAPQPSDCPSAPYTDLDPDAWYHAAADYVIGNGIMVGVDTDSFGPQLPLTRAQTVTILYRLAGKPASSGSTSFTDVPGNTWYTESVAWAAENGIVMGVGDGLFAPDVSISRQDLVCIFYRYAAKTGMDVSASGDLSAFADASRVASYAAPAMAWAIGAGLISGTAEAEGLLLAPTAPTTRIQAAQILLNFSRI